MKNLLKKYWLLFSLLLFFGLGARAINLKEHDVVFGYDEVEDLIHVKRIVQNYDLVVIGKAIYGFPQIRHGVLSYYLTVPGFWLARQNPFGVALWTGFFNLLAGVILFWLSQSLFKKRLVSLIAVITYTFSYLVIEYSGWVAHPTYAPFWVTLFFFGLWQMFEKKTWGWILSLFSLGLAIQSDLLFLHLIPAFLLFLLLFRVKLPDFKTMVLGAVGLAATLATVIYTEIKFNFSGLKTILNFGSTFEGGRIPFLSRLELFTQKFIEVFSRAIIPGQGSFPILLGILIIFSYLLILLRAKKKEKFQLFFLLFCLLSPALTLLLGYHDKPWTFLGIIPVIFLVLALVVEKLKSKLLITFVVLVIVFFNLKEVGFKEKRNTLFPTMPRSSFLSSQLWVVDYTYQSSAGKSFSIDAVTYPLYVNTYWSYHFPWYGLTKYGYLPTWSGSDQLYPHDSLFRAKGDEAYLYLIIDETPDIPFWAKGEAIKNLNTRTKLLEEKKFDGFTVQKRELM